MSEDKVELIIKLQDELTEELKKVNKQVDEMQANFEKSGKSIFNFANYFKAVFSAKVFKTLTDFSRYILTASSSMTELQNVTDQVFENMAGDIDDFARRIGAEMGRSVYDIKKYTSDAGAVLKGLGGFSTEEITEISQSLAKLSVDMGSFKNIDDAQAFNALRGAIVGETEALKTLGVVVNDTVMAEYARTQGIKESWQTLDIKTKAELRYQKILEATSFMQGDAARTIESYANQLKVFEANLNNIATSLGNKLTPAASSTISMFNRLLSATNDWLNKKSVTDYYLEFITKSNDANKSIERYVELSKLKNSNQIDNKSEQERIRLFNELKQQYPSIFDNLSNEAKHYEKVAKSIEKVNEELKAKMTNQVIDDAISQMTKEYANFQKEITKATVEKQERLNKEIANNKELKNANINEDILNKGFKYYQYLEASKSTDSSDAIENNLKNLKKDFEDAWNKTNPTQVLNNGILKAINDVAITTSRTNAQLDK